MYKYINTMVDTYKFINYKFTKIQRYTYVFPERDVRYGKCRDYSFSAQAWAMGLNCDPGLYSFPAFWPWSSSFFLSELQFLQV